MPETTKENNITPINQEKETKPEKEKRVRFARIKKWFHKDKDKEENENEGTEDEPERRTFGQWLGDWWGWIAGGAGAIVLFLLLYVKYASESDEDAVDPEIETEPGDWEPNEDSKEETAEPETEIIEF